MNHVPPDQQRDAESALLDGNSLQFVDDVEVDLVEQRPDPALADGRAEMPDGIGIAGIDLAHLADFLDERHLRHERGNALLDGCIHRN